MYIKDLLKEENKALQVLNYLFGFDFQANFGVTVIEGKTTVNQIIKAAKAKGFNSVSDKIFALMRVNTYNLDNSFKYEFMPVVIAAFREAIKVDFYLSSRFRTENNKLNTFSCKKDFFKACKDETARIYIYSGKTRQT